MAQVCFFIPRGVSTKVNGTRRWWWSREFIANEGCWWSQGLLLMRAVDANEGYFFMRVVDGHESCCTWMLLMHKWWSMFLILDMLILWSWSDAPSQESNRQCSFNKNWFTKWWSLKRVYGTQRGVCRVDGARWMCVKVDYEAVAHENYWWCKRACFDFWIKRVMNEGIAPNKYLDHG